MEIGRQIRKHRLELHLSQEELAERVYVTRQTVSNWENDKSYPDINSLVLLSTVFNISLDILVKGDLKEMEEKIKSEDVTKMKRESGIFAVLLIACIVLFAPLYFLFGIPGIAAEILLYATAFYYSIRLEKQKKKYDVQTYREIQAFMDGKRLDEIEKAREAGKRPYQTVLYIIGSSAIAFFAVYGICMFLEYVGLI